MIEETGNNRNTFKTWECEHSNKILKIQGSKEVAFELGYWVRPRLSGNIHGWGISLSRGWLEGKVYGMVKVQYGGI